MLSPWMPLEAVAKVVMNWSSEPLEPLERTCHSASGCGGGADRRHRTLHIVCGAEAQQERNEMDPTPWRLSAPSRDTVVTERTSLL